MAMPTPNVYFKIVIVAGLLLLSFCGGYYVEHLRFLDYRQSVAEQGKIQEQKNKDLLIQQQLITKQVTNDYENKLARINSYYAGLHYPSSSKLSSTASIPEGALGTTSDPQFAQKCAATTLQLESLIDEVNKLNAQ